MLVSQQTAWTLEYLECRYMRHLSQEELCKRTSDILSAIVVLRADGMLEYRRDKNGVAFLQKFAHIQEEMRLRGIQLLQPGLLPSFCLPEANSPKVLRGLELFNGQSRARYDFASRLIRAYHFRRCW